jgi:hypothetical protein
MKRRLLQLILFITLVISFSCKDYLTVAPKDYIPFDQAFKKADDAISAVYGLYALMQPCVDQLFLAGDVQSDLVVAARGADSYIAEYNVFMGKQKPIPGLGHIIQAIKI